MIGCACFFTAAIGKYSDELRKFIDKRDYVC